LLRQAARGWGKRLFQRAGAYEVISLGFSLNGISGIPGNRWSETKENIKQHLQTKRARMMMIIREAGIEGRKLREGKCGSPDPGLTIFGHIQVAQADGTKPSQQNNGRQMQLSACPPVWPAPPLSPSAPRCVASSRRRFPYVAITNFGIKLLGP